MGILRDKKGRFIKGSTHSVPKGTHNSPDTEFKKGHKMSEEVRQKISATMKGKSSKWLTGRKLSQETKDKMSESSKGIKFSKESIEKRSGENHWNWKGGITHQNEKMRKSAEWKKWRTDVFNRDNYICQNSDCPYCGNKRGAELHPHHIKQIHEHPELIYDIDNGITYCSDYHIKGGLHRRNK